MARQTRIQTIVSQLMNGCVKKKTKPTEQEIKDFENNYRNEIAWLRKNDMIHYSAGVIGAIGKAYLWYGKEKIESFLNALKHGDFRGKGDPAHVLFIWLSNRQRYDTKSAYRMTVAAIRAYVENKTLVRKTRAGQTITPSLRPARTDIFEWNADYTEMHPEKPNQYIKRKYVRSFQVL